MIAAALPSPDTCLAVLLLFGSPACFLYVIRPRRTR